MKNNFSILKTIDRACYAKSRKLQFTK